MYCMERGVAYDDRTTLRFTGYFPDSGTIAGKSVKSELNVYVLRTEGAGSCDR